MSKIPGSSGLGSLYGRYRIVFWICTVLFVNQLGFGSVVPVVPLYAKSFDVSQAAIGLTVAVYGLARFLTNLPTGWLADRVGRRWTLVLGEVVTATGNLLCGLSTTYEQFLFCRLIAGAGGALVATSGQVILADVSTRENRARSMSLFHAVFLAGNGAGPVPVGYLASHFGLSVPFYAFAGLGVVAALLALDKIPETGELGRKTRVDRRFGAVSLPLLAQYKLLFRQLGFAMISGIGFVQTFARTGALYALVPLLAAGKLRLSPEQIGMGLGLVTIGDLVMVYFAGMIADRWGRKPAIVPASLVAAVGVSAFAAAPDFGWYLATLALWGVAMGLGGSTPAAYAADVAPPGMNATTLGCFRMAADLGYIVGPALLGWIADISSIEMGLYATSVLFTVTVIPFALLAPETGGARFRRKMESVMPVSPPAP